MMISPFSRLDEYTARLILASEEVKTSYEQLVRLSSETSSGHHHLHNDLLLPEMGRGWSRPTSASRCSTPSMDCSPSSAPPLPAAPPRDRR